MTDKDNTIGFLILFSIILIIIVKILILTHGMIESYEKGVLLKFAHFGGIPNDSQIWGYQVRHIF